MARRKLKKFAFHPITTYILLIAVTIILSFLLSLFDFSTSYNTINVSNGNLEKTLVSVNNLLSYDGMKYVISNAAKNFISSTTLSTLLITLIGLGIAEATGFIETFMKRRLVKVNPKVITFIIFLLAVFSSIVNEVGYAFLIPLGALLFLFNGRNPLSGIAASFAGVAFGYSISFFVGTMDINLLSYTTSAANLIDKTYYVRMTSNLIIMIVSCIVLSFVGTFITERFVVKKLGRYVLKTRDEFGVTKQIEYLDLQYEEQKKIKEEKRERNGLKYARIAGIIGGVIFLYMIIPGLPLSGMLLDLTEEAYVDQLFGVNSYFQDGFTYMMSILFAIMGIFYGIGSKSIKNDKELFIKLGEKFSEIGILIVMLFFSAQFIAIFKESNIGIVITAILTNILKAFSMSGIPLIIVTLIVVAIANIFLTSSISKWAIMSPTIVPMMMQLNINPAFAQFVFRAGESMTNGVTPLLAYFVVYIGYLNIYNKDKEQAVTLGKGLEIMMPYFIGLAITWILIVVLWYVIGLPIGINVFPAL